VLASGRHLSGNPTNQACAYGYLEETSRYRLPPANRSRRVCLRVAQAQNTPHSRIPLNAPTKSGDQDVEVTEKKQFPVSGFSGGWNLALGSGKEGSRRKNCASEDQEFGCDMLCAIFRNRNGNPG
jgi:hypothetical protein